MSSNSTFTDAQLHASAADALSVLLQVGDSSAEALIAAWVTARNGAAVQEAAERANGKARKSARRGLNVLKSKGVPIPPRARKASVLAEPGPNSAAWLLPPDSSGIRVLAIAKRSGSHWRGCIVYLRDDQAVFKLESSQTTPAKLTAALEKALPGSGLRPVPVPVEWAVHKVAQARAAMAARKLPEPLGFMSAKAVLEPVPSEAPEHPFDTEGFVFEPEDAKAQASDSGSLHHQPEFRSWLPAQKEVQQLLVEVGKHLKPGEEPDQDRVSELLKQEMLAATDRTFTPELRADLVKWMKDAGVSLVAREGEAWGLKLAATIQCIESAGLVTDPPRDVPFLRAFFEKAIGLLMAQNGGKLNIPIPKQADAALDAQG